MEAVTIMKKVKIYDQYRLVLDADNETILHAATAEETELGTYNSLAEAVTAVTAKYNESKTLGTTTDKIVDLDNGYAEFTVVLNDGTGRSFVRVIYTANV